MAYKRYCLTLMLLLASPIYASEDYAGSASCADCHSSEYQLWQSSHHQKAMQLPSSKTVSGDFANTTVEFDGARTQFSNKDGKYSVETVNKDGQREVFNVVYTFGFEPLQQYILDAGDGHLQAFDVAWDNREVSEGGQRWFQLQPGSDITGNHPLFWQRHLQNWNSRCAECHTTGFEKNYDALTNSYKSEYAEPTVGCEACHGSGKQHIEQVNMHSLDDNKGFKSRLLAKPGWEFAEDDPIANPVGAPNDQYMEQCAFCHSRRLTLGEVDTAVDEYEEHTAQFHNRYGLNLLSSDLYFDDGQIKDEVFVVGSFLQSKMAHSGVTCSNCHDPHSGEVASNSNSVCAQCHLPTTFDTPEHHFHLDDAVGVGVNTASGGTLCVDCHMPSRTYMQIDERRDHSFIIPSGKVSEAVGSPNACLDCHADRTLGWVDSTLNKWYGKKTGETPSVENVRWPAVHLMSDNEKMIFIRDTMKDQAPIVEAKLLSIANERPSQESLAFAVEQLDAQTPLIRRAAIDVVSQLSPETVIGLLAPLLGDASQSVRYQAAATLANKLPSFSPEQYSKISSGLEQYRQTLLKNDDSPDAQLALGQLALAKGNADAAKLHFKQALVIAPTLPASQLGMATYWRATKATDKEYAQLEEAAEMSPESSEIAYQLGLYWVRARQYATASKLLIKASQFEDSVPHYAYVAAAALDKIAQTEQAVQLLSVANVRWPQQENLLTSLALYAEKTGNMEILSVAVEQLEQLSPDSPDVKRWKTLLQP